MPLLRALEVVMTGEVVLVVVVKEELPEGEEITVGLRVVMVDEPWLLGARLWVEDVALVMFGNGKG